MAKIEQMLRLKYIEEFLRRSKQHGASYQEITNYLEEKKITICIKTTYIDVLFA